MIRTAAVIATLIFAAVMGNACAADNLITEERIMFEPGPPAMFLAPPKTNLLLLITREGRVFWKGREVETDDEFRAAMIGLAEAMAGGVRKCPPTRNTP